MAAKHEEGQSHYPCSGFNPENNPACRKISKSYGGCCGPCDSPCYMVNGHSYSGGFRDSSEGQKS